MTTPTPTWTIEPHGDTFALYENRDEQHNGFRLCNLSDGDEHFELTCRRIAAVPLLTSALCSFIDYLEKAIPIWDAGEVVGNEDMEQTRKTYLALTMLAAQVSVVWKHPVEEESTLCASGTAGAAEAPKDGV